MTSIFNLLLVFTLSGSTALANNKIGNGGNVVLCKIQKTSSVELLDFYEVSTKIQTTESDAFKIAEKQLQRLKIVAPKLAAQYLQRLAGMQADIDYRNNISLTTVSDSLHLFKPLDSNCEVVQIAIRKPQTAKDEKHFLIREDLWKNLSPSHQAGLLTHEIIYEHFSKLGEKNSIKARKLNRYIFGENLKSDSFWKFIQELEIPIYP
ncbi:MAG: hypothetical protein A2622_07895 [Bdellovibrionales bacterium RIFCSPHIGHO2_01_FULL_40_29]|nr:MAG: hypothetical protein A2622_07895 [Bdellovibrionales bacterium RIFCSPHIGHO2_01_FULL_40_29]OFZ33728.1 MAG: hypothetical protein A3D17_09985 [Bdellovibrionales bacterium RIFCSPHIGHO2_02_FULL_40_15]